MDYHFWHNDQKQCSTTPSRMNSVSPGLFLPMKTLPLITDNVEFTRQGSRPSGQWTNRDFLGFLDLKLRKGLSWELATRKPKKVWITLIEIDSCQSQELWHCVKLTLQTERRSLERRAWELGSALRGRDDCLRIRAARKSSSLFCRYLKRLCGRGRSSDLVSRFQRRYRVVLHGCWEFVKRQRALPFPMNSFGYRWTSKSGNLSNHRIVRAPQCFCWRD